MGLKDLPVIPGMISETVQGTYVKDIHAVQDAAQLKTHAEKWMALFQLEIDSGRLAQIKDPHGWVRSGKTRRSYTDIIEGKVNYEEAFQCLKKGRVPVGSAVMEGEVCEHAPHFSCAGMHFALPLPLMNALFVAEKYGVTTDLALIQANGGLETLEGAGISPTFPEKEDPMT